MSYFYEHVVDMQHFSDGRRDQGSISARLLRSIVAASIRRVSSNVLD